MNIKILLILLTVFSTSLFAKGRIFSLGAGLWKPESTSLSRNGNPVLGDFSGGKFARISHEGLLFKNTLYVIGLGVNLADTKVEYEVSSGVGKTNLSDFKASLSMVEAKLGLKYNLLQSFYIGGGVLIGDLQLSYDRSDYIEASGNTNLENYQQSENQNYFGHYAELGFMIASKHWGSRLGAEYNSISLQNSLDTLGGVQPVLKSTKLYIEILWKN